VRSNEKHVVVPGRRAGRFIVREVRKVVQCPARVDEVGAWTLVVVAEEAGLHCPDVLECCRGDLGVEARQLHG
jgi:hypothetical protein